MRWGWQVGVDQHHLSWTSPRNNTIDLFEIYFQEEEPDHMPEILNLKTIALFKDSWKMAKKSIHIFLGDGRALNDKKVGIPGMLSFGVIFSIQGPIRWSTQCYEDWVASGRANQAGGFVLQPSISTHLVSGKSSNGIWCFTHLGWIPWSTGVPH